MTMSFPHTALTDARISAWSQAHIDPLEVQPITARLAGAGSLRLELEALLAAAPTHASSDDYRNLLLKENVAGKASAMGRMWAWKRLKLRYALDPTLVEHQAFVKAMRSSPDPTDRGLVSFLMFARTDRLFREVTLERVSPHLQNEDTTIEPSAIEVAVRSRMQTAGLCWSAATLERAHNHLLTALKDFGVVRGSRHRRTIRLRPGGQTTLFACWLGHYQGLTDRQVLDSPWFRLLGIDFQQTADLLYVAHRQGLLGFRMQADVVELSLPPIGGSR